MSKKVFLSYSHDSEEHREKVLALSERLRADGIETLLDQYVNGAPEQGWPRWMLDQLDAATFVLVVCTETYYRRFRGHEVPGQGKGVDWEGALITTELYYARSRTLKFVPVFLSEAVEEHIPEPLRASNHYALTTEEAYQRLYDFLLEQSGVEPRPIGVIRKKARRRGTTITFGQPPSAAERNELVPPEEFIDEKLRLAAVHLAQARANNTLTMPTLIDTLNRLFDRHTFRRSPSVGKCPTQEWDIRLHTALQTRRLLDQYEPFVKTEARESWKRYGELAAEVSRYCECMAAFLFRPPVGPSGLRGLVGTSAFIEKIRKKKSRFEGGVDPETCERIDPHLTKSIELMEALHAEFCSPAAASASPNVENAPGELIGREAGAAPSREAPVGSSPPGRPRVYISYTWREKLGEDRALKLANQLRAAGIDARIDRYYRESLHGFTPPPLIRPGEDAWTRWQEEQIRDADRVLLICGLEYATSPPDSGVARDLRFMEEDLKRPGVELRKFVPVGFAHYVQNKQSIPQFLQGANYYNLGRGSKIGGLKDLIRHFGNEFPVQAGAAPVQDTTTLARYPDSRPATKDTTQPKRMSKQPTLSMQPPVDFVIITPLEEERESMLRHLGNPKRLPPTHDDIRVYYPATVPVTFTDDSTGCYKIVLTEPSGMGHVDSANVVGDAIRRWQPRYILVVGIAGGLAKAGVNVGDVLIGDQIADYELQKLTPEQDFIRWSVHRADPRLLTAAKQLRPEEWRSLVCVARPESGQPQRHTGPICTGNKVIANGLMDQYRDVWTKLIGVEMEAGGVASAALQAANAPGFFMVRGVSDLADAEKDKPQVHSWRAYACDVAAAYVMAFLKSGPVPANPH